MAFIDFKSLIIYEDEDYVIVNKPAMLASLDDRGADVNVLRLAKSYAPEAQACHRLDKETSGAMALAKNAEAYRLAAVQFEQRKVEKIYHAIVDGIHTFQDAQIDLPLAISGKGAVKIDNHKGKASKTIVNTLETFKLHSLLECKPVTGRMHQIRVHLSATGAPISGDALYGGAPLLLSKIKRKYHFGKYKEEWPLIKRTALHAKRLQFTGVKGQPISAEAPYPKDFEAALKQLKKYG